MTRDKITYWKKKWNITWKNTLVTASILALATAVAYLYHLYTAGTVNIIMFYTIALIFIPRYTEGYWPGIFASMISVVCVNFFFTFPFWKINFWLEGYPVTFICMLVIAIIVSAATSYTKEQSRLLAKQEKLLMEAEKEKMRANLLRAVSHDLRTPLTGIIGASGLYLEGEETLSADKKRDLVRHINEDGNWLLNMVENLLTVTRIREDATNVSKTLEPVEEVISEAVKRMKKRHPDAQIKVHLPEEFIMIPMDAMLIGQVLLNLMENAYLHAHSNREMRIYTKDQENEVVFFVKDFGVGIAPEKLDTIFDGVSQTENDASDSKKGIGIGLSICKTIIVAHGGKISATNHNEGAEFFFTLPKGDTEDA